MNTTFYEYAVIAAHVYNPYQQLFNQTKAEFASNAPGEKKKDGWYRVTDVPMNLSPAGHFYAALYIKFQDNIATQAVVAIRGTVFNDSSNIWADAAGNRPLMLVGIRDMV